MDKNNRRSDSVGPKLGKSHKKMSTESGIRSQFGKDFEDKYNASSPQRTPRQLYSSNSFHKTQSGYHHYENDKKNFADGAEKFYTAQLPRYPMSQHKFPMSRLSTIYNHKISKFPSTYGTKQSDSAQTYAHESPMTPLQSSHTSYGHQLSTKSELPISPPYSRSSTSSQTQEESNWF